MKVICLWFPKGGAPIQKLAEHCLRLSPQMALRGSEALFIEIGKCKKIYSEAGFFARLEVILRRLKLSPWIAKGQDIPEALALARFQKDRLESLPLEALLDFADPFNKDPVVQKYVMKMISAFTDLGIKNLGQFNQIPLNELVSRFGPVGVLCQQRSRGQVNLPWPVWRPEEIIFEKTQFPYFEFYGELEPILFELKKHLDLIFQRLWSRTLKVQTLQLQILCERTSVSPEPNRNFEFDFLFPQSSTKGALNVIKERLAKEFTQKPIISPIEGMKTTVKSTVPGSLGQKSLLHNREEITEQLNALLNQLTEAHGKENIYFAETTQDRRPEKSWKRSQKISLGPPQSLATLVDAIPLRPHYLIKPEKIRVSAGFVYIKNKPHTIIHWPDSLERISGGWVEGDSSQTNQYDRNYHQVELESGLKVFIFQTPNREFYLHGYFE